MRAREYDSAEFTLATGQTDNDIGTNQANAFANAALYTRLILRTNKTITIKLNSTTSPSITIAPTDSPFQIDWLEVTKLYISNASGATAAIKMIGVE